ncbi:hypothetical protein MiSe_17750 [Microseira wollei NIES-4236]|uniref:Transposase n=1 Tax=Microseira wollei NIES-4236 TaxID=2530354 RepID=A0AAV3X2L8_9CYAN|nr:hypothetical protein MiSe_17750 [Microseira wollei NIES-4236]
MQSLDRSVSHFLIPISHSQVLPGNAMYRGLLPRSHIEALPLDPRFPGRSLGNERGEPVLLANLIGIEFLQRCHGFKTISRQQRTDRKLSAINAKKNKAALVGMLGN